MTAANIAQNVACDIALLERTRRLAPPPARSSLTEDVYFETQSVFLHDKLGYLMTGNSNHSSTYAIERGFEKPRVVNLSVHSARTDAELPSSSDETAELHVKTYDVRMSIDRMNSFERSTRQLRASPRTPQPQKPHNLKPKEDESVLATDTPKKHPTPGPLPQLSSILLPLPAGRFPGNISLVYVTTESDEAGAAIVSAMHALHPTIKVVSTVDDLSAVAFTHTYRNGGKEERLKPVCATPLSHLLVFTVVRFYFDVLFCPLPGV